MATTRSRHRPVDRAGLPARGLALNARAALGLLADALLFVLAAALAVTIAYQVRPAITLDMAARSGGLFLPSGFYAPEQTPDFTYRWLSDSGTLHLPGIGAQPLTLHLRLTTAGLDPQPSKTVTITAGGAPVAVLPVHNALAGFAVPLDPRLIDPVSGDLTLTFHTATFSPPGDPRRLGVMVDRIAITSAGSPGLIAPPIRQVLLLGGLALGLFAILVALGVGARLRRGLGLAAVALGAALDVAARPAFALYSPDLLRVVALTLVTLLLAQPLVTALYRRGGLDEFAPRAGAGRGLFALFAAGLLTGWAGLVYPLSDPHDFGFHLHRFEQVQAGHLFFANYVVAGVGQGFYPPGFYVFLLPFGLLTPSVDALVRLAPALLDFAGLFIVYYLVRRYLPVSRAAPLLAAALYAVLPINLLLLWWAHETNLFGLVVLLATMAYLLTQYDRITRPPVWLGLVALCFTLLLSHPGVLVWSLAFVPALLLVFAGLRRWRGEGSYRAVAAMAGAFVLAGGLAFVLYYSHYAGTFGQAAQTRPDTTSALQTTLAAMTPDAIANRWRMTWREGVLSDYVAWPLLLAPLGLGLAFRRRTGLPSEAASAAVPAAPAAARFRWTLATWLVVGCGLWGINLVFGLPLRPLLFLFPGVAMTGGVALAAFLRTGAPWRRAAVTVLLLLLAGVSLTFWAQASYLDLRIPHVFPHVF